PGGPPGRPGGGPGGPGGPGFPPPGGPGGPGGPPSGGGPGGPGGPARIEFKHVQGTLEFQGRTYKDVDVRFKGNFTYMASSGDLKRPFKIDLNEHVKGQNIDGQTTLNLANNVADPSKMREALAYAICRR